jgi:hypothetical protein
VPDDLIKLWLGHSQNLIDLYAAQLRYDDTYRRGWCDRAGLGFELGELAYKSEAPIRPALKLRHHPKFRTIAHACYLEPRFLGSFRVDHPGVDRFDQHTSVYRD